MIATATQIGAERVSPSGALQRHYRTEGGSLPEYVVVSAMDLSLLSGEDATTVVGSLETYIFPADKDGNVLEWIELNGSFKGELNHERALREAGYEVQP